MPPVLEDGVLSAEHAAYLENAGITPDIMSKAGVRTLAHGSTRPEGIPASWHGPGILFPWHGTQGVLWQYRPDTPEGKAKYLFPKGEALRFSRLIEPSGGMPVILCEGTKQHLAVASYAAEGCGVYGVAGCWGWAKEDLTVLSGHEVIVLFDADLEANRDVHDAASRLQQSLDAAGAVSVSFARVAGSAREGIDDVLARVPQSQRAAMLARILGKASVKLPRKPAKKVDHEFFDDNGLKAETLAKAIFARYPSALSAEGSVAMYDRGAYRINPLSYSGAVSEMLGELFRPAHRAAAEEYTKGTLYRTGRVLPAHLSEPLVNCANGMLDLSTGTLKPHDPSYLSWQQIPVAWEPEATCPFYEEWVREVLPGDQLAGLEELAGAMLDPSRTPHKAVFLFGESHSGKSTFLRIMCAVAGPENTSSVTLHQLAEDRFAAANVYGKMLNCAADLSAEDVSDLSMFKMMSGEDQIPANRKYGQQFAFTNQAMFAFSANEPPAVSETSNAYFNRIAPFSFPNSFAGRENPDVEHRLRAELPGILVRWVKAYQRYRERGSWLPADVTVSNEFEIRSDRVRLWVSEKSSVVSATTAGVTVTPGSLLPPRFVTSKRELFRAFTEWAKANNGKPIGERKFIDRLTSINGVFEVRNASTKTRGLNVVLRGEDEWEDKTGTPPGGTSGSPEPTVPIGLGHLTSVNSLSQYQTRGTKSDDEVREGLPNTLSPKPIATMGLETASSATERVEIAVTSENVVADTISASATALPPALTSLFWGLRPVSVIPCEHCGESRQPVPPSAFWYACPSCYPSTFAKEIPS